MGDEVLRRTSLPSASAASRAGVDSAVRSLADAASGGLPAPWPRMLLEAAKSRAGAVPDALDRAVGGADLGTNRPPRWWRLVGAVQWVLLAAAVAGGVWLGVARRAGLPADRSRCALTWAVRMADGAARRRTRVGTGAPSADQTFRGGWGGPAQAARDRRIGPAGRGGGRGVRPFTATDRAVRVRRAIRGGASAQPLKFEAVRVPT